MSKLIIEEKNTPLKWGELDLGLFGLSSDWYGKAVDVPAAFGLAVDDENFWFVASRRKPALIHPDARPGRFTPELWKYDVAEFFISHPETGRYIEFNLAPNGAWWSAEFTAPRVMAESEGEEIIQMPGVKTYADMAPDGTWVVAVSIPLDILKARIGFGEQTMMNVTFIDNSPDQQFLTAKSPDGGEPDFHRPDLFLPIHFQKGGLTFENQKPADGSRDEMDVPRHDV